MQRHGERLQDEQEVLSHLADIVIDAYAAESAVLRALAADGAARRRQPCTWRRRPPSCTKRPGASSCRRAAPWRRWPRATPLRVHLAALRRLLKLDPGEPGRGAAPTRRCRGRRRRLSVRVTARSERPGDSRRRGALWHTDGCEGAGDSCVALAVAGRDRPGAGLRAAGIARRRLPAQGRRGTGPQGRVLPRRRRLAGQAGRRRHLPAAHLLRHRSRLRAAGAAPAARGADPADDADLHRQDCARWSGSAISSSCCAAPRRS